MRKLIGAGALLAAIIFGLGYLFGQVRGPSSSFAAGNAPNMFQRHDFARPFGAQGSTSIPKHADGQVTAISGNTVTVSADNDADNGNEYSAVTAIQLTSSTQYSGTGGKSAVKVGSRIMAAGTVSSDGKTMTASHVWVGGAGNCPHNTSGTSTSTSGGSFGPGA